MLTPGKRKKTAPSTPRKRKAPASPPPRRPPSRLEFRAPVDGAWYVVRVVLQEGALRVMYEEFFEDQDEWYDPAVDLAIPADVAALRARFRTPSRLLDDARCRDLRAGAPLCVYSVLGERDRKFYDAVLDSVVRVDHEIENGEEQCKCRFEVRWTDGPHAGRTEFVGVERIYCVQASPVQDPVLNEFLDGVGKSLADGMGNVAAPQATGAVKVEVA